MFAKHGKRIIIFAVLMVMFFSGKAFSEVITLISGDKFEAEILDKTDQYIVVDWEGSPVKYSLDEVRSIEKDASQAQEAEPVSLEDVLAGYPLILEYLQKADLIITEVVKVQQENQRLLAAAVSSNNKAEADKITASLRDSLKSYKEKMQDLPAPLECVNLKSAIMKWLQVQEDLHTMLIAGDMEQARVIEQQVSQVVYEMQQEIVNAILSCQQTQEEGK